MHGKVHNFDWNAFTFRIRKNLITASDSVFFNGFIIETSWIQILSDIFKFLLFHIFLVNKVLSFWDKFLLNLFWVWCKILGNRIDIDAQKSFFEIKIRSFRAAPVTKVQTILLINVESIHVGEVISVWFFTEGTVFEPEYIGSWVSELDLVLV